MTRIDIQELNLRPFHILDQQWALLVSGTSRPNPMTVSWGGFGTLWHRPIITVYVRSSRHTFTLLRECHEFTLNFLSERQRAALDVCGNVSGRDCDKWKKAAIEPERSAHVAVPRVAGAVLAFECRVVGAVDMGPDCVMDKTVTSLYSSGDYHRVFWGEVLAAYAGP